MGGDKKTHDFWHGLPNEYYKFTDKRTEAEKQELIVHIHFDAKYKVQDLEYLIQAVRQPLKIN